MKRSVGKGAWVRSIFNQDFLGLCQVTKTRMKSCLGTCQESRKILRGQF